MSLLAWMQQKMWSTYSWASQGPSMPCILASAVEKRRWRERHANFKVVIAAENNRLKSESDYRHDEFIPETPAAKGRQQGFCGLGLDTSRPKPAKYTSF